MVPSIWQILLVILVGILLFGRGRISDLMGDMAKGIKSFRKGLSDTPEPIEDEQDRIKKSIDITQEKEKN